MRAGAPVFDPTSQFDDGDLTDLGLGGPARPGPSADATREVPRAPLPSPNPALGALGLGTLGLDDDLEGDLGGDPGDPGALGALDHLADLGSLGDLGGLDDLGDATGRGDGPLGPRGGPTETHSLADEADDPAHAWLAALEPDAAGVDLSAMHEAEALPPPGGGPARGGLDDLGALGVADFNDGPPGPAPVAGFVFGADLPAFDEDEATLLDRGGILGAAVGRADADATRVVAAAASRPMVQPSEPGWRVRAANGLVYELQNLDAVVAWLEGKPELSGIVVARGAAVFQPVDAWPELAARLRRGRPGVSPMAPDAGAGSLDLDVEAGPRRVTGAAPGQSGRAAPAPRTGSEADVRSARRARIAVDSPLGFGVVLASALGALGLAVAVAWLVGDGNAATAQAPQVVQPAPDSALAVALAGAQEALAAGHHTSAVEQLETLRSSKDPRVERLLALALHRQGREREARAALERYRAAMVRKSGEHGRQVREVRD